MPLRNPEPTGNTYYSAVFRSVGTQAVEPASILVRHLDEFSYALNPDWDGRGAQAVSSNTVKLAQSILNQFAADTDPSEVTPGRDGSLSFIWDDANNYVYFDIGPNSTIHLYYHIVGEPKWEAVSVVTDEEMLSRLANALVFARSSHIPAPRVIRIAGFSGQATISIAA
jgi:hypothetical protein